MTPAQHALAEAARAETARIYSAVQHEHKRPDPTADRELTSFYGPADPDVLERLVADLNPLELVPSGKAS